ESHTSQDTKIYGSVVLSGSRVIFIEDDIELPVQLIFNRPVGAYDFEHTFGRQPFGQDDVVHRLSQPAIGAAAFGFNAADGGEIREGGRVGRPGNDAGAAQFVAVVSGFALLEDG